ncbi:MAG: hypothetical protein GKC04_04675 [Methanomicrobiales archaeon]|nr:hypothetical protein [Methanomicrobiales archaeon]
MGSASLIASAIALILLIITAYVIVGGTIASAEIISYAQAEQVMQQEIRMRTAIEIVGASLTMGGSPLVVQVMNTGSEPVGSLENMDVYLAMTGAPTHSPYGSGTGTWRVVSFVPDTVHPGQLDPDEVLTISVSYAGVTPPAWVQVTTANGVYDSAYV